MLERCLTAAALVRMSGSHPHGQLRIGIMKQFDAAVETWLLRTYGANGGGSYALRDLKVEVLCDVGLQKSWYVLRRQ